ncbi:protein SRC2-like [Curcuma longa]|uniref:protein SRC2-like n=1 Tax=Curcuma longa TaxID=136217 RepID=UPI003D9F0595
MAYRTLEITLISAKGLKEVNLISKMAVYAVVSLSSHSRARQRTPPDRVGGRNPTWDSTLRFTVPADADLARKHFLNILLRTERTLGDRDVGEVRVPLSELLSGAGDGPLPVQFISYQVRKMTSGKPKGVLNFSYKLGERVAAPEAPAPATGYPPQSAAYPYPPRPAPEADEPVMAYPVGTGTGYGAPPPPYPPAVGYQQPQAYGYPPAGYGYPPAGYAYGAAPPQPPRKNRMGLGLGAGLLGGALGGLLIGDMISDAASYDAGYDAGFDDGGGFDF